jgi:hypothetical protein
MCHKANVAVDPQIQSAIGKRALRAVPLHDKQRDIGSPSSQFVGDPGEDVDAPFRRRVKERQVSPVVGCCSHALDVDWVRQDLALKPARAAKMGRREPGENEHGIRFREQAGILLFDLASQKDHGQAPLTGE